MQTLQILLPSWAQKRSTIAWTWPGRPLVTNLNVKIQALLILHPRSRLSKMSPHFLCPPRLLKTSRQAQTCSTRPKPPAQMTVQQLKPLPARTPSSANLYRCPARLPPLLRRLSATNPSSQSISRINPGWFMKAWSWTIGRLQQQSSVAGLPRSSRSCPPSSKVLLTWSSRWRRTPPLPIVAIFLQGVGGQSLRDLFLLPHCPPTKRNHSTASRPPARSLSQEARWEWQLLQGIKTLELQPHMDRCLLLASSRSWRVRRWQKEAPFVWNAESQETLCRWSGKVWYWFTKRYRHSVCLGAFSGVSWSSSAY